MEKESQQYPVKRTVRPEYVYHVFPISKALVNAGTKHEEFSFDSLGLSEEEFFKKLSDYNVRGYNVYKTFNTFVGLKRDTESVYEFRGVLVDLDFSQEEKPDYLSVISHCNKIKKKYGIFPVEINETYKGYHLLYALSEELFFIDGNLYLELSRMIVGEFGGDYEAKQITGLYKVPGYVDYKEDAILKKGRNFKIVNKFNQPKSRYYEISIKERHLKIFGLISEDEDINDYLRKELLGRRIYWKKMLKGLGTSEKAEAFLSQYVGNLKQKAMKKKRHDLLIESIDARVWIDAINDAYLKRLRGFTKPISVREDGISIDDTDGLKLYFDKNVGKYRIKDFSRGTRYGNKKFIFAHYFGIQSLGKRERKIKTLDYVNFLSEKFGIIPQVGLKKTAISEKVLYDYLNGKIERSDESFSKSVAESRFSKGFAERRPEDIDWFRTYFNVNAFIQSNSLSPNESGGYEFDIDDFADFSDVSSYTSPSKRLLKDSLEYLNCMKMVSVSTSGKKSFRNLAVVKISKGTAYFSLYNPFTGTGDDILVENPNASKFAYFPNGFGKFSKKKNECRKTRMAAYVLYGLFKFKAFKFALAKTGYSRGNALKIMAEMKESELIPEYAFSKSGYFYVGTKKYLSDNGFKTIKKKKKSP